MLKLNGELHMDMALRGGITSIWIEAEHLLHDWDPTDSSTGVLVDFADESRWEASFYTYKHIISLNQRNQQSSTNLGGLYLWDADMILIEKITREGIEAVIHELIAQDSFERAFSLSFERQWDEELRQTEQDLLP